MIFLLQCTSCAMHSDPHASCSASSSFGEIPGAIRREPGRDPVGVRVRPNCDRNSTNLRVPAITVLAAAIRLNSNHDQIEIRPRSGRTSTLVGSRPNSGPIIARIQFDPIVGESQPQSEIQLLPATRTAQATPTDLRIDYSMHSNNDVTPTRSAVGGMRDRTPRSRQ